RAWHRHRRSWMRCANSCDVDSSGRNHPMPASLSPKQIEQYQRDGYLFPVDCLTADEVRYYRGSLEDFERGQGDTFGRLPNLVRSKSHLLFTWMDQLVRHPKVLDAVESIIGPNILLY